ncbi:hypothetical protein AQUCO_03000078v1 [Aquilegia coerulea]|uniref:Thaumatin-like protein n=1 Tax=Aquilegia coerulea TaxID=218851 RepID=A0A2G5D150_AQUCA|nr:hypothetical protein AQUCO_03000078v1 [Aquilegia coerulea]
MEPKVLLILFMSLMIQGAFSATFTFRNNCPYTVWPGIQNNPNVPQFPTTGFQLTSGASQSSNSPGSWAGRIWARTGCNGQFTCATGTCAPSLTCNGAGGSPPVSLAEFTLNGDGVCPANLSVRGSDGRTIACKSACLAFGQPQYCCTGEYNNPDRCTATDYSRIFKNACPQAYSYAYDDRSSTFTCPTGANYAITFCP